MGQVNSLLGSPPSFWIIWCWNPHVAIFQSPITHSLSLFNGPDFSFWLPSSDSHHRKSLHQPGDRTEAWMSLNTGFPPPPFFFGQIEMKTKGLLQVQAWVKKTPKRFEFLFYCISIRYTSVPLFWAFFKIMLIDWSWTHLSGFITCTSTECVWMVRIQKCMFKPHFNL